MNVLQPSIQECPVLVIAYDDNVLSVLVQSLASCTSKVAPCTSFCAAESVALQEPCRGVLVDLTAMIKAKSEEKIVAYTLASFFPTLRVRAMGPMIVPMNMSGGAKQDKSLNDFLSKTCAGFAPRRLRRHKRRSICIPTFIAGQRGFTLNLSWDGAFIADMNPERFTLGDRVSLSLPDFETFAEATVTRVQLWGEHRPPGVGVGFVASNPELQTGLHDLLHSNRGSDHDRQIA